jgi:hypothetical protein
VRTAVATLIAGLLLSANAYALAGEEAGPPSPNPIAAGFDVVILRPLGLVAAAVGAALFVPVALVTAPNGLDSLQSALTVFVTEPAKSVFQRPLGDF